MPQCGALCVVAAASLSLLLGHPVLARVMVDTTLPLSEVVWVAEQTLQFVGSPTLVKLENSSYGSYLAARNEFGPGG